MEGRRHGMTESRFRGPVRAAMLALALAAGAAGAATAATVSVVPADTTVTAGDAFTLRVVTTSFPDLKAFQFIHAYAPAVIQLHGIDPGDVLTRSGRSFYSYWLPDAVAPADTAWYDAAMLDGSTSGPGILGFLVFKATAVGVSPVDCLWVDFRDSYNVQTLPSCTGGMVHVVPPVAVRPDTWGRIKALYR